MQRYKNAITYTAGKRCIWTVIIVTLQMQRYKNVITYTASKRYFCNVITIKRYYCNVLKATFKKRYNVYGTETLYL